MRLALFLIGGLALAATENSVDDVVTAVRAALRARQSDEQLAKALHRLKLDLRLDDRTAEELESEAPGPKSIAEIERLRELTRELPLPGVLPWFASPPDPTYDQQVTILRAAMHYAMDYTASLPDFICTQTVHRYERYRVRLGPSAPRTAYGSLQLNTWTLRDTLTVKLTYFDREEDQLLTAVNGRKTTKTLDELGGAQSKGEFGSMLLSVFAADSAAVFRWRHWTTLRKRPTYVFSFQIDRSHSHYTLRSGLPERGGVSTVTGEHGLVYIDRDTKQVLRLVGEADSIPPNFPVRAATRELDYGFATVGAHEYLLPLHADVRMEAHNSILQTRNDLEFTEYRKFSGESTINFGETVDPPVKK